MAPRNGDRPNRAQRQIPGGWPLSRRIALAFALVLLAAFAVPALAFAHHADGHDGGPPDGRQSSGLLDEVKDAIDGDDEPSDDEAPEGGEDAADDDASAPRDESGDGDRQGQGSETPQAALPRFAPERGGGGEGDGPLSGTAAYILSGAGGLALLGLALVLGRQAARPVKERPADAVEAARRHGLKSRPGDHDGIVRALRRSRYTKLLDARIVANEADVSVKRKRGIACGEVSGFVGGLFEHAWGRDVDVEHVECAGRKKGPCAYRVRARVPRPGGPGASRVTSNVRPGEGASTRESSL